MEEETELFTTYENKPESVTLLEESAKTLDRFIDLTGNLLSSKDFTENERYDIDLMCDLSSSMMIQLLNMIKGHRGDYEFFDDITQMNDNGEYE